jgi:hypothetical protein
MHLIWIFFLKPSRDYVCCRETADSTTFLLSKAAPADSAALAALDAQIAKDEHLLRAQESIVNKAESMLLSRVHNLDNAEASRSRASARAIRRPVQRLMASPPGGGDPRPLAAPWTETVPDHSHVYLQTSLSGPEDEGETDGDKIADWNRFFDGFTKRVDAPKWGVKDLLVDNLEGITACNIDCDKNGLVGLPCLVHLLAITSLPAPPSSSALLPLPFFPLPLISSSYPMNHLLFCHPSPPPRPSVTPSPAV